MFICVCNAISERDVLAAVAEGAHTLADLQGRLGVASCCGSCADTALDYLPGGRYASPQAELTQAAIVADAANDAVVVETFVAVAIRRG